jgi:cytochrome c-type biogenesis protein CcmH
MIIFWILAGGLMGLAILFIALPLLNGTRSTSPPSEGQLNLLVYRRRLAELDADLAAGVLDRKQYDATRRDLEREMLHDLDGEATEDTGTAVANPTAGTGRAPILALVLSIALPLGAVLTYLQLGDHTIIPRLEAAGGPMAGGDGQAEPALDDLVKDFAARMEQTPDNVDGWLMLGRTYFTLGQPAKALESLERAYQLAPKQANVIVAYAEALGANAGNRLSGRPEELIRTALEIEPANPNARWLNGMLAYQQGQFGEAAQTWQAIKDEMDPAAQEAQSLGEMIAEARRQDGQPPTTVDQNAAPASAASNTTVGTDTATATGARVQVQVALAPALAAQAAPEDTLFVFARAPEGQPMPLAARRFKVADLPATVTLDDSMAIVPGLKLSTAPEVLVGARISKSGQATPSAGDLEGQAGPVKVSETSPVTVTIDRVRP